VALIYGEKKVGKTSLCAQFPDTFFLMFEPGGKGISIYQRPVNTWIEFLDYVKLLKKDKRFHAVVIDTVEAAYDMCFEYSCKKMAITHPQDENDYGKSWKVIKREFVRGINALLNLNKGVFFIGHSAEREVKTRGGGSYTHIQADMAKQAYQHLLAVVDFWFYYGYQGTRRVIVVRGNDFVGAGCRPENRFYTTAGKQIYTLDMGLSAAEAHTNLLKGFDNQLEHAGEPFLPSK
jgi:hypothetical protein